MELQLTTPEEFPIFPYERPYDIQLDLMRHLFSAIESRKVAVVESPTGTGKTLSLLSGSLSWLNDEKARGQKGRFAQLEETYSKENAPSWIVKQSIELARQALLLEQEDFQARLDKARQKEEPTRKMSTARVRKRQKVTHDPQSNFDDEEDEERFLPEDGEDDNLSSEVKELMKKLQNNIRKGEPSEAVDEPTCTKIFYASRTHSQLSQLQVEFEKLKPISDEVADRPIARAVSLGSRRNLCINDELRVRGGDLDEGCRELLNEKGKKRCKYLPPPEEDGRMQDIRDHILATPRDIEDLAQLGRELKTCPYYGSRRAIKQAELVVLPYNLLLRKQSREALGIDMTDQVIIIDEAHNLIDTILSIHTVSLSDTILKKSLQQLRAYLQRFRKLLTPRHALHLRRLTEFLVALDRYCDETVKQATEATPISPMSETMMKPGDLMAALGKKVQSVNLLEIEAYLRSSKVARKISGYNDKLAEKEGSASGAKESRHCGSNPPLHAVQAFIITLLNANEDGKIIVTTTNSKASATATVSLKYQLLNPSRVFQDVVDSARAVVLAGGTMAPLSDFRSQLLPYLPEEKLSFFSCGHVMPAGNLKTLVVSRGPTGNPLLFKHQQQKDPAVMNELGQILTNLVTLVPDGLVVFFPSYSFLNAVRAKWKETGVLDRLGLKKMVYFEPQDGGSVETVLAEYTDSIRNKQPESKSTGAVLLAVVGAKLSEGLNFSDNLARAVVVVGLPFANMGSVELKERMRFVKELDEKNRVIPAGAKGKDAGMELYENLCMKAVNQSIGRAIRHQNDWAALILLDERYASARVRAKLPKWIGEGVTITETFGQTMKELGQFYRARKAGHDIAQTQRGQDV